VVSSWGSPDGHLGYVVLVCVQFGMDVVSTLAAAGCAFSSPAAVSYYIVGVKFGMMSSFIGYWTSA